MLKALTPRNQESAYELDASTQLSISVSASTFAMHQNMVQNYNEQKPPKVVKRLDRIKKE